MISPTISGSSEPITLEAVKTRFDHWRTTRQKRSKIPESLWDDVTELAKRYEPFQIASALRLNSQRLHAHLENLKEAGQARRNLSARSEPDFVKAEVPFAQQPSHPLPQWPLRPSSGTLEIQGKSGLTLKAAGLDPQDLADLVRIFLMHKPD